MMREFLSKNNYVDIHIYLFTLMYIIGIYIYNSYMY